MTTLKFEFFPHVLEFTSGSEWPAPSRSELTQIQDRSAGNTLRVENLGVNVRNKTLVFSLMPKVDLLALINWYENISVGALNPFEYTDEFGEVFTVRMVSPAIDYTEVLLLTCRFVQ